VIQQEIPGHPFVHLLTLQEGGIEFVELQLREGCPAAGRPLRDLTLPDGTAVPLLIREGKPMVVQADTILQAGDKLIAVTTAEQESTLKDHVLGAVAT
jgi:trk system potassium uptake protein